MINPRHCRSGLVFVEVLAIVCSLFLLFSVSVPGILAAREASRRSQCKNNLKQIGLGLHNYHDTHRLFPPGWIPEDPAMTSTGPSRWSWNVFILPFVDQVPLYDAMHVDLGTSVPPAAGSTDDKSLPVYLCPADAVADSDARHRTAQLRNLPSQVDVSDTGTVSAR